MTSAIITQNLLKVIPKRFPQTDHGKHRFDSLRQFLNGAFASMIDMIPNQRSNSSFWFFRQLVDNPDLLFHQSLVRRQDPSRMLHIDPLP
jgi:hypothetical protein